MLTLCGRSHRSLRVRLLVAAVAAIALLGLNARAAGAVPSVLYVDGNNPNCSDTGSGDTSTQPFCTIKKAGLVAVAGQTVQVSSGTYPDLVTVSNSGSAGSPIVFTPAPGASVTISGPADGFKLSGKSYVTIQGFTIANTTSYGIYIASSSSNVTVSGNTVSNSASNGIYVTTLSSNVTVSGNTVSGANGAGIYINTLSNITVTGNTVSDTTSYGIYNRSSSNVTINGNHVSDTESHAIYVSPSSSNVTVNDNQVSGITGYGFWANSSSGVTVSDNTISNTSSYGLHVDSSSNVTVSGNDVSSAGQRAVDLIKYGIKLTDTTASLVSGNVSHDNSNDGIFLDATTNGVRVTGNQAFGNARGYARAAPGIDVRGYNNTVDRNVSHDNEDSGFQFYTGSHDNLAVDNLAYFNGDHGIDDLGSTNQRIISNTVWGNYAAGINVEGSSTGATVENNIAVDNGHNVSPCFTGPCDSRTRGNIRVDSTSTAGTTVNYNLVYLTSPDTMYVWGSSSYTSLKDFRGATGQESHADEADPSWVSTGSDFHLLAGSPAIDSADSAVSGATTTDLEGLPRVDDPSTRNAGGGPRKYDDRGAYEFQP
jgi:parallel beta-helix repeat protein